MDILQVMKEGHEGIRRALGSLLEARTRAPLALDLAGKRLQVHLAVEGEYLCPEIEDRFPGSPVVIDIIKANHRVIRRIANEVWGGRRPNGTITRDATRRIDDLAIQVERHLDTVEKILMPKLRQFVPTLEREDLGQVIQDVIEERRAETVRFGLAKSGKSASSVRKSAKPQAKRKRA